MVDAKTLQEAIEFAAEAHRGQVRKGNGKPYIIHPLSVMGRLSNAKKSSNMFLLATVAVLHDTVEDCGVKIETIANKFGYYVAGLVLELTLDKAKYETIGKTKYLCQELSKMSSYALCIKLCDRLDNIEDTGEMTDEWKKTYFHDTVEILDYVQANRKTLTKTHKKLIKEIRVSLKKRMK